MYNQVWDTLNTICMYICMVITHSKAWINRVSNPARDKLNRETGYFPVLARALIIWSRETGSAVPPRVILLILHTQAEYDMAIVYGKSMDQPGTVANPVRDKLNKFAP